MIPGLLLALGLACAALPPDFVPAQPAEALPPGAARSLGALRPAPLAGHIAHLADPAREGRGLGSRGLADAAAYVAAHLEQAGLRPLRQDVPLREIRDRGGELKVTLPGGKVLAWTHRSACLLPELEPGTLEAPVVFAGWGIREPALGHDDLAGLDVKGKAVLIRGGVPAGEAWQRPDLKALWANPRLEDRYDKRVELLERLGATMVIVLEDGLGAPPPPEPFFLPPPGIAAPEDLPRVRLSAEAAAPLLELPPGTIATLRSTGTLRPLVGQNVLAVLPGTDPRETVVVGAHLDHLGMRGGALHPGADDNASGVAALLEIARALAPARLRRTVVFAFWTGEEEGKFGSNHYVRNPLRPLQDTVAYVNLDMIGHPWTAEELRTLVLEADPTGGRAFLDHVAPAAFAEPGYAEYAPQLAPLLARAGRGTGMALHLDPGTGWNGGSDYRGFARAGVPWIRFFGDFFPGYHSPRDTPDRVDPAQVLRMARLALATVWLLAEPEAGPPRRTTP